MSATLRTYLLGQTAILLDAVDGIGASGKPRRLFETRRAAQQVCLGAFTGLLLFNKILLGHMSSRSRYGALPYRRRLVAGLLKTGTRGVCGR